MPQQVAVLRRYLESAELATVEREAHTIKGVAGNCGARRLCETAAAMELAGKAGNLETLLPELESVLGGTTAAMRQAFRLPHG